MNKEILSAYELADRVGCKPVTIYDWVKRGLPYTTTYKGLRKVMQFDYEKVIQWIQEQKTK